MRRALTEAWDELTADADITGRQSFAGMQAQAVRQMIEHGESLPRLRVKNGELRVQMLAPEQLPFEHHHELDDGNVQILNSAATFHQNSANLFRKLADLGLPQEQTAQLNNRIESHLKTAIPYLETLTETKQDAQKYWGQLFQIHSYLGNTEKADEAMKKSDL